MLFLGLLIFVVCVQFLPWFALSAVAFILGVLLPRTSFWDHFTLALVAGVAQAACAFYQDGRNYGLISRRMAGLFALPNPSLMFLIMAVMGFISVLLWLRGGLFVRQLCSSRNRVT